MIGYQSTRRSRRGTDSVRGYRRRQRRQRNRFKPMEHYSLHEQIVSRDALYAAFQAGQENGGSAPGLDGIRYDDLSPGEMAKTSDWLSKRLHDKDHPYRPQPTRQQAIPKPGTSEKRVLHIGSICDRAVAKSLNEALSPHFEQIFLDGSCGFRRDRGPHQMLADLEATMMQQNRLTLVTADIRKAFDNVRIDDVLDAHQRLFNAELAHLFEPGEDKQVLAVIRTVLCGADTNRQVGIDQGNPYSATAFNAHLHFVHDVPLTANVCFPFWYRYADNLAYLCQDVPEGQRILRCVRSLLRNYHLELKQEAEVCDLSAADSALLLGLRLRWSGKRLIPTIGRGAWDSLGEQLRRVHSQSDPTLAAKRTLLGWVDAWAMAFETVESAIGRVLHVAVRCGFRECCSRDELRQRVERARLRWQRLRRAAWRRRGQRAPPLRFSGFD